MIPRLSNSTIWPTETFEDIPIDAIVRSERYAIPTQRLPRQLVEYAFRICEERKFKFTTLQLSILIICRYLRTNPPQTPLQLLMLASVFLASKIIEINPLTLNKLHQFSNHDFTNKDVNRTENHILNALKYDLLCEGVPGRKVQAIFLHLSHILRKSHFDVLIGIAGNVEKLIWYELAIGSVKVEETSVEALPAVIVNIALTLATQSSGRFMHTIWCCSMLGANEDSVGMLTSRFLKVMLGSDRYHAYNF